MTATAPNTPAPPPGWSHGLHSTYCAGCRCQPCRDAHRVHMRRWRSGSTRIDPAPRSSTRR